MIVKPIESKQAMALVLRHHYSNRKVGAKYSHGLFIDGELKGCIVYSQPASYTLCKGVCGEEYRSHVIELSRMVVTAKGKNVTSMFLAESLRMLPDHVVVSYADCNDHVGHLGIIYQATNWVYTGQGNAEPKWINPKDGTVVSYTRRHIDKKAEALGLDWRDLVKGQQVGKHRYVTFTGEKRFRKRARKALRYKVLEYPKGETARHEIDRTEKAVLLF